MKKEPFIRLAHYDSLTALPNQIFFNEILNKSINHAARNNKTLALLLIDLDQFNTINDASEYSIGNLVLKEVADRFSSALRSGDVIARFNGDEFIVLLNDIGHPKLAGLVAEKLLQTCSQSIKINAHEFCLTASIGICIFPNDGTSLEDLQKNADLAMYKAKKSGKGAFQYFTKEMTIEAHQHLKLESALRKAIENKEFTLHYQPKFNIHDGLISSVEALIRWNSPALGLMNPETFIPFAETSDLIMQIGEWVLREACRANKSWQDQGFHAITIAINLSPKQFRHQDIAQLVADVLFETGLAPEYLELEITENTVMDNVEAATSKLNAIQAMGVKIAIDDFGTGYTSIYYLKQFPLSILKIDQSFIKGIPTNQNDAAITTAVIALAHSLGMKVVGEGVETAEQLQYLADYQCDMAQGYFLSRPLPEQKLLLQLMKISSNDQKIMA